MQKITLPERPQWRDKAQELGFTFADMHGEPYWDETSVYQFNLRQIEDDIEDPSTELHAMCREAAAAIVASQELMEKLAIPEEHRDLVANSWANNEPEIYGRFDLAYDGSGPAKMLEYNADTPTSLYESASFQWSWLEDHLATGVLNEGDDQFNGIHEALVARFQSLFAKDTDLHFTAIGGSPEDYATVECMGWAAREAGLGAHYTDLEKVALSTDGQFLDAEDRVIGKLFKLYPWEDLLRDDYAINLKAADCLMLEPAWKAVLSNKGLLPVLWQMFEGHPNLLPAYFEDDAAKSALGETFVRKPLFSREGASIQIVEAGETTEASPNNDYAEHAKILQAYAPLPEFAGFRPVIGSWIIGTECAGIGIREDRSRITQDLSRFKPHFIRD
ncbi:glutathionylspermidine synthase family protein [Cognatishimia sp. 1_MG-2023]|uniref:glutathionylspermidine synthase family protein n=1 Tax=Cognatishimia sp. 1_MG-2023 TaxID=3062642 RepID=UPI0026E3858E|nr:glutathionylspermidine synthase family protein [Cognatishimia sp. 1_MG-2023]MDO6725840.1 glutathionylspermidine synthase family protein [Cognatishimia sp. 1_MG-2023]